MKFDAICTLNKFIFWSGFFKGIAVSMLALAAVLIYKKLKEKKII